MTQQAPLATLRQRLAALLLAGRIYAKAHWRPLLVACLALVFVLLVAFWPAPKKAAQPSTPVAAQQANPLAPLVARIEALEEQVADLQQPPAAPGLTTRRAPAVAAPAPAAPPEHPPQAAPPPPPPPAPPITRQSIDQFRASLRTSHPHQE